MATTERPTFCTDQHLRFLDDLRKSGITNMFGAAPYLQQAFTRLDANRARKVLSYWMHSFSERHPVKADPK
jgi:hypothetical protein